MEQVLLADGMSILVRAARAALRAKPLSWRGVTTGPLLMFAGTMVNHLSDVPWDYVVVTWEGVPERNWRRALYPEYKSNRPPRLDDASAVSRDEELAREFCTAAGLFQDWAPEFEGDDIIAAWWRLFRAELPEAKITILTSDRDLLQLCDERTICKAWHNEAMNADDVREIWGVEPAMLPLMRALAGDPSDGIPGMPGIGLARATTVASSARPPDEIIAALSESRPFSADEHRQLMTWYNIIELRNPVRRPEAGRVSQARWEPVSHLKAMREFWDKYGLARLGARQAAGRLPWPPAAHPE